MTLLVRDEADVVEAHLAFHLTAGIDFVVATDNRSQDGTTEILEAFAREGHLHLIREERSDFRQSEWVTRMARLAATEYGADWVINSDADEFWWPRGRSLKDVLAAVPERYGQVKGVWRSFVPRPDDGRFFAERMTVRLSPSVPINDPSSTYRPQAKVAHRGDPNVVVSSGNHALLGSALRPLRGWYPIEVLHLPVRTMEQWERKNLTTLAGWRDNPRGFGTAYHERAYEAHQQGRMSALYDSLVVSDSDLARGLESGLFTIDTRLRDALRELRSSGGERSFALPRDRSDGFAFPEPTLGEDAEFAVHVAALMEADIVRLQRRLDALEESMCTVELRRPLPAGAVWRVSRAGKRMLRLDRASS